MTKKTKRQVGLSRRDYPRNIRERFDYDYIDKLPDDAKRWLAEFNEAYYCADFTGDDEHKWSTKQRRETYVAKNAANRDIYGIVKAAYNLTMPDRMPEAADEDAPAQDWSEPPPYLNDPLYIEVVRQLREAIDARPRNEARVLALRRKLETFYG